MLSTVKKFKDRDSTSVKAEKGISERWKSLIVKLLKSIIELVPFQKSRSTSLCPSINNMIQFVVLLSPLLQEKSLGIAETPQA